MTNSWLAHPDRSTAVISDADANKEFEMARKQIANILEAHLEKLILIAALVVSAWIVYTNVIAPTPGAGSDGLSPSELARKAAEQAQQVKLDMERPSDNREQWQKPPAVPSDLLLTEKLASVPLDRTPLHPPISDKIPIEHRIYLVPEVPALTDPKIELIHATALIPVAAKDDNSPKQEEQARDVDIVVVQAAFPLARLRSDFLESFAGSAEEPLDYPDPVVAATQLQQSRLNPNGAWSPWQTAPRLPVDPLAHELAVEDMASLSQAQYEVLLEQRRDAHLQADALQPRPYRLAYRQWISPTEEDKPHRPTTGPRATRTSGPAGLDQEEVILWVLDENVEPGAIYRYRLRLGFFNPIAGHDWFTPEQADLKGRKILWSQWIQPENMVRIPERLVFFPKTVSASNPGLVPIEVCRWQNEKWYHQTFQVAPGAVIGRLEKPDVRRRRSSTLRDRDSLQPTEPTEPEKIDFTTGATLIDIIPNRKHVQETRNSVKDISSTDIIYATPDGQIKRIGTDKKSWPKHFQTLQAAINKAIRSQEAPPSSTDRPRPRSNR